MAQRLTAAIKHLHNPPALAAEVPRQVQALAKQNRTDNPPALLPGHALKRSAECILEKQSSPASAGQCLWVAQRFTAAIRHSHNRPALAAEVPRQVQALAKQNRTDSPPALLPGHALERSAECILEKQNILLHPALADHKS